MQKKKIHWLGNRQFYRTAMALGIPLMFQQLITSSVNLVDNLMVGQLGNTALSSVAAVNRLTMVAIFAVNGLLDFYCSVLGIRRSGADEADFSFLAACRFSYSCSILAWGNPDSGAVAVIFYRCSGCDQNRKSIHGDRGMGAAIHRILIEHSQRDAGCRATAIAFGDQCGSGTHQYAAELSFDFWKGWFPGYGGSGSGAGDSHGAADRSASSSLFLSTEILSIYNPTS